MQMMQLNRPLYHAYLLKEDLRQFWSLSGEQEAEAFLEASTRQAQATGNRFFRRLAKTLQMYRQGLLG